MSDRQTFFTFFAIGVAIALVCGILGML